MITNGSVSNIMPPVVFHNVHRLDPLVWIRSRFQPLGFQASRVQGWKGSVDFVLWSVRSLHFVVCGARSKKLGAPVNAALWVSGRLRAVIS